MLITALLFFVGLIAGFVDAIAGGGGLLTLPALLTAGLPVELALGTNKGQSAFGTAMSLTRYYQSRLLDIRRAALSLVPALIGGAGGVWLVTRINPGVLTPLVMVLLACVALFMLLYRPPKVDPDPRKRHAVVAVIVAFLLSAYDGFFGPGTGMFLILVYAWLWRDPLDKASANAKVANFGSNIASMAAFAWAGLIVWKLALPMAAGQLIGAWAGAHVTVRRGSQAVRVAIVVMSLALLGRLAWQFWGN